MKADLAIAKRDNALHALKAKAEELRKARPELSRIAGFREGLRRPANRALADAERQSARAALYAV